MSDQVRRSGASPLARIWEVIQPWLKASTTTSQPKPALDTLFLSLNKLPSDVQRMVSHFAPGVVAEPVELQVPRWKRVRKTIWNPFIGYEPIYSRRNGDKGYTIMEDPDTQTAYWVLYDKRKPVAAFRLRENGQYWLARDMVQRTSTPQAQEALNYAIGVTREQLAGTENLRQRLQRTFGNGNTTLVSVPEGGYWWMNQPQRLELRFPRVDVWYTDKEVERPVYQIQGRNGTVSIYQSPFTRTGHVVFHDKDNNFLAAYSAKNRDGSFMNAHQLARLLNTKEATRNLLDQLVGSENYFVMLKDPQRCITEGRCETIKVGPGAVNDDTLVNLVPPGRKSTPRRGVELGD